MYEGRKVLVEPGFDMNGLKVVNCFVVMEFMKS